jgi:hypothetical protein
MKLETTQYDYLLCRVGQLALAKVDFIENKITENKCCVGVSYDGYDLGFMYTLVRQKVLK